MDHPKVAAASSDVARSCCILIPSCDEYSDLWEPFFFLFWRFLAGLPIFCLSGIQQADLRRPRVRMLHSTSGLNWSNRMMDYLSQLDHPNVILMLEDFFLRKRVDTSQVTEAARKLRLGKRIART